MNAAVINKPQKPELDETQLAEKSVRSARILIWVVTLGLEGWLAIRLVDVFQSPYHLEWLKGVIIALMLGTFIVGWMKWQQAKRDKFRLVKAPANGWPQEFRGRLGWLFFWISYGAIVQGMESWVIPHFLGLPRAGEMWLNLGGILCSLLLLGIFWWGFSRNRIVISDEAITIFAGSKIEDVLSYHEIERIVTDEYSLKVFCVSHPQKPITFHSFLYSNRTLAAVVSAIEKHAPQATFDTEADLMRRGYFSW